MNSFNKSKFIGFILILLTAALVYYKKGIERPIENKDFSGTIHQSLVKLNFLSSLKEAMKKSKSEHKLIFAFTRAQWCPFSERTIEKVLSQNQYQALLKKFILLHFDIEALDFLKLNVSTEIQGTNTILIFNQEGQEIARFGGTDLEEGGTKILAFLGQLDSTVHKITTDMSDSRIVFDSLIADKLSFYNAKSYSIERLRKEKEKIQAFKDLNPNIDMTDAELEIDLFIAQHQGSLKKMYGKLLKHKNTNLLAAIARYM